MQNYDVIGIGAGPANLSISALMQKTSLSTIFLERQSQYNWHPGMLLPESVLQVSFLKDLVTLVDPTNEYSFLSFLQDKGALYQFITAGFSKVFRSEFSEYLSWTFNKLKNIMPDSEVKSIEFVNDILEVTTNAGKYQTKNLILGTGLSPHVPDICKDFLGERVFHSHNFLLHVKDFTNKRIAVIGGGQSGAEIINHILQNYIPSHLTWLSRRSNFSPIDDSVFTNELYTPTYSNYFYNLSEEQKRVLLIEQKLSSDGISESTAQAIYQKLYHLLFIQKTGKIFNFHPKTELIQISQDREELHLLARSNEDGDLKQIDVDYVVLCTGYIAREPEYLARISHLLPKQNGNFMINADYSLQWERAEKARIFIQNGARHSHGIPDPNLSLLAYRSARIINTILGYNFYDSLEGSSFIDWTLK